MPEKAVVPEGRGLWDGDTGGPGANRRLGETGGRRRNRVPGGVEIFLKKSVLNAYEVNY